MSKTLYTVLVLRNRKNKKKYESRYACRNIIGKVLKAFREKMVAAASGVIVRST